MKVAYDNIKAFDITVDGDRSVGIPYVYYTLTCDSHCFPFNDSVEAVEFEYNLHTFVNDYLNNDDMKVYIDALAYKEEE